MNALDVFLSPFFHDTIQNLPKSTIAFGSVSHTCFAADVFPLVRTTERFVNCHLEFTEPNFGSQRLVRVADDITSGEVLVSA